MPKKMITSRKVKSLTLDEAKTQVRTAIKEKYDMSVNEFANSEHAVKLKIKPSTLNVYLGNNKTGSNSFPAIRKLMKYLKLGEFNRTVQVIKTHTYFMELK